MAKHSGVSRRDPEGAKEKAVSLGPSKSSDHGAMSVDTATAGGWGKEMGYGKYPDPSALYSLAGLFRKPKLAGS